MKSNFDTMLLSSGSIMKKSGNMLVNNAGRAIAVITVIVAILVTFTDVGFTGFSTKSFTTTMIMMLIASYVMYFSLEDSGEKLGEESEEYKAAKAEYDEKIKALPPEKIPALRSFLEAYAKDELEYRRNVILMRHGYTANDFKAYCDGTPYSRKASRVFKKVKRETPVDITPAILLSAGGFWRKSELSNPESKKLLRMLVKLLPTTVCTTLTVSVMLTTKENLSAATVMEGLLKLSTLPIIGFRGYSDGYNFVKGATTLWTNTKTRLLASFLKSEGLLTNS